MFKRNVMWNLVAPTSLGMGFLLGWFMQPWPRLLAGVVGLLFTAFVLFMGMVLASARQRTVFAEKTRLDEEMIANLRQKALQMLDQQSRAYSEVSKAQSSIVSSRIGIRIVEEMLHGLENDEQKDAAYRQLGIIITEELAKVNSEVWGDKLCPKDTSEV